MSFLKDAARDAPNLIAVQSKEKTITFKELDQIVDRASIYPVVKEKTSLKLIVKLLATLRKGHSILILNPKNPLNPPPPPNCGQAILLYTSGSTAKPKIAIAPLKNLINNARDANLAIDLRALDQYKLSLPLYHVSGISILIRCVLARATLVLEDSLAITHLSCIPTHLHRAIPIYRKLRCLLLGGAPISKFPKYLPIHETYGLTEMSSMVTFDQAILPNRDVTIAKDKEILVKGPTLIRGYLGEDPFTGWFATKDLGEFRNNKLEILGRKDWMFISGGENIQPEQIEKELLNLKGVFEAVVLAIFDPELGKKPVAVVRADPVFSFASMLAALEKCLPPFKIPKMLFFIREMPLNSSFKLNRFFLSQLIEKQLDQDNTGQKNTAYL